MATKKAAPKKRSAAPLRKTAVKKVPARTSKTVLEQDDPMVRALVVTFAAFSVIFTVLAAWRYGDW